MLQKLWKRQEKPLIKKQNICRKDKVVRRLCLKCWSIAKVVSTVNPYKQRSWAYTWNSKEREPKADRADQEFIISAQR